MPSGSAVCVMLQLRSTLFPCWSDKFKKAVPKGSLKDSLVLTSLISISKGASLPSDEMTGELHGRSVCSNKDCPRREVDGPQSGH